MGDGVKQASLGGLIIEDTARRKKEEMKGKEKRRQKEKERKT